MDAKQQLVYINFGLIGWHPNLNNRLEYGTLEPGDLSPTSKGRELGSSIAEKGWKPDYPATVSSLVSSEDVAMIMAYRKDYLSRLEARANGDDVKADEKKMLLAVVDGLKAMWRNGDEWVTPKYIGITGNRRASVCPWAVAYKRVGLVEILPEDAGKVSAQRITEIDPSWVLEVPCLVHELDRIKDFNTWHQIQTTENSDDVHRKPYTAQETGLIAISMWRSGEIKQQTYRNIFGSGTGPKLYVLAKLDSRFPNLEIRKRIALPPTIKVDKNTVANPDYIGVQALKQSEMQTLQQRIDAFGIDELNRERAKNGKTAEERAPLERMTESDVDKFLRAGGFGELRDKAMALKDAIEVSRATGIDIVQRAFGGMKNRDLADVLANDMKKADLYNLVTGIETEEHYRAALAAVKAIVSPPVNAPATTTVVEPITSPEAETVAAEVVDETKPPKNRKSGK